MPVIELSAGTIEYDDVGRGPVIVALHGLLMDASLWHEPVTNLSTDHRCITPTLPMGAHRTAMGAGADLSLPGQARLTAELLERLDLRDVTLVGNDTGGAVVQLLMTDNPARVAQVVLASCDAFDNFPPGLTGRTLALAGKLPPAIFGLFMQQMRARLVRRLPVAFGWLTKRGDAVTARWMRPVLDQPEIRRDTVRMLRAVFADRQLMMRVAARLPARLRLSRPGGVGQPGPDHATRPRAAPGRPAAAGAAGRDSGQLHAHPPGTSRPGWPMPYGNSPRCRQAGPELPPLTDCPLHSGRSRPPSLGTRRACGRCWSCALDPLCKSYPHRCGRLSGTD